MARSTIDMHLVYTNCEGEELHFGKGALHYREHDLFGGSWDFTTADNQITTRTLKAATKDFPITIAGGDLETRERVYSVFEKDAAQGKLGTFTYGDWELQAVAQEQSLDKWWIDDGLEERKIKLLSPRPYWVRHELHQFVPSSASPISDYWGGDYPLGYPYGYPVPGFQYTIDTDTFGAAEFVWRVYGAAVNPYIIIDGNRYEVDVTVPTGSYLEVDTQERTIDLVNQKGERMSCLNSRVRGGEGSGTYVFKRIPTGRHYINSAENLAFDIIVYNERTQPKWQR